MLLAALLLLWPQPTPSLQSQSLPAHVAAKEQLIKFWQAKLTDPLPLLRKSAARNLGALKAYSSLPLMLEALSDSNPEVRDAVVRSLAIIGNEQTISYLQDQIDRDPDRLVKKHARDAIQQILDRLASKEEEAAKASP